MWMNNVALEGAYENLVHLDFIIDAVGWPLWFSALSVTLGICYVLVSVLGLS